MNCGVSLELGRIVKMGKIAVQVGNNYLYEDGSLI